MGKHSKWSIAAVVTTPFLVHAKYPKSSFASPESEKAYQTSTACVHAMGMPACVCARQNDRGTDVDTMIECARDSRRLVNTDWWIVMSISGVS